jgi:hypothetical protein
MPSEFLRPLPANMLDHLHNRADRGVRLVEFNVVPALRGEEST